MFREGPAPPEEVASAEEPPEASAEEVAASIFQESERWAEEEEMRREVEGRGWRSVWRKSAAERSAEPLGGRRRMRSSAGVARGGGRLRPPA